MNCLKAAEICWVVISLLQLGRDILFSASQTKIGVKLDHKDNINVTILGTSW
jgi:hypothetical protein